MKVYVYCLLAAVFGAMTAWGQVREVTRGRPEPQEGVEILTRGPVHEAFAETVTFDPEPGIVVAKAPPDAIEESPPEQRPEGNNVAWIPGYWAWDDERTGFLWVSGIWRNLPPGRQWVPGYWGEAGQDYQWTSGYWADATISEVEYLPEPPATIEAGPNIAAQSADQLWAPGSWIWNQSRYAWRPGYWATAQPDWSWVPAHYVWSPSGYVFVDGYYDYSVDRRGVLFAPVYFNANVYSQPGFSYSPAMVINPAVFASQLFLRPQYQHYYFGDYYSANYSGAGYHPWFSYNNSRYGYDPIYAQQRWQHRDDRAWEQNVQADFQNRRDHENARPPRTWTAQSALIAKEAGSNQKSFVVAAPLDQLAKSKESPLRFQAVDQEERQRLAQHGQDVQKFRQERQNQETRAGTPAAGSVKPTKPTRVKLPQSPIVATSPSELRKDHVPPPTHVAPRPDLKVEPKPRVAQSSDQVRPHTTNRLPVDPKQPQPGVQPQRPPDWVIRSKQPQPQPRVNAPNPQRQPKANRSPQPQPRVNQPAPQPQPRIDRPQPKQQAPRQQQAPQQQAQRQQQAPPQQAPRQPQAPRQEDKSNGKAKAKN